MESLKKISENRKGKCVGGEHHNFGKKIGDKSWFILTKLMKSDKNPHRTDETKKKISEANSGEKNGMYGKRFTRTDEQKEKLSNSLKNSDKLKKSRQSTEFRQKLSDCFSIPLFLLDLEFNILKEFKNLKECSEYLGCTKGNVKNANNDLRKLCKKYWIVRKKNYEESIVKIKGKLI